MFQFLFEGVSILSGNTDANLVYFITIGWILNFWLIGHQMFILVKIRYTNPIFRIFFFKLKIKAKLRAHLQCVFRHLPCDSVRGWSIIERQRLQVKNAKTRIGQATGHKRDGTIFSVWNAMKAMKLHLNHPIVIRFTFLEKTIRKVLLFFNNLYYKFMRPSLSIWISE